MSPSPGQASGTPITRTDWSKDQVHSTSNVVEQLAEYILADHPSLIGLSGAPGCGKSTLATLLIERLAANGVNGLVLSLDDYYLGKMERLKAAKTHPLFAQRGVPGTHDWSQLICDLDRLKNGELAGLQLPRFDKMNDDRRDETVDVATTPDIVILEGWVVGAPPQSEKDLMIPVNSLESSRDADGLWRTLVNNHLKQYEHDLGKRVDAFWFLSAPDWECAVDWRWQQEQQNAKLQNGGHLESRQAVAEFLDQFQRLASHMIETATQWADVIIDIDPYHLLSIRN